MPKDNFIILPTQLFEDVDHLSEYSKVYLIEDPVYFTRFEFHRLKIAFHRATMQYYYSYLKKRKIKVKYISWKSADAEYKRIKGEIWLFDPVDKIVMSKLGKLKNKVNLLETPAFPESYEELSEYKKQSGGKYVHDSSFYRWQRRRMDVLMKDNSQKGPQKQPEGSQWTYDDKNREKFPKGQKEPVVFKQNTNRHVKAGIKYAKKHFGDNPGRLDGFVYPVTHKQAKRHFRQFLNKKLKLFGKYQDAISDEVDFGYHSVISCLLNTGLLTSEYVVNATLRKYRKKSGGISSELSEYINDDYAGGRGGIPINSVEGFLRQVIGWRSYCRLLYEFEGDKMRSGNYMRHYNKLNDTWWQGTTQLEPVDVVIRKVQKYAYAHHIERLMILGNAMLLCFIHPDDVFEWFISFVSIDAYDWVMVPNIYGMSQYADGGIMMTRPYFSSSNYILKMSNYTKSSAEYIDWDDVESNDKSTGEPTDLSTKWTDVWDALYYNFVDRHQKRLKDIYSTANAVKLWQKKSKDEKKKINKLAEKFIETVTE